MSKWFVDRNRGFQVNECIGDPVPTGGCAASCSYQYELLGRVYQDRAIVFVSDVYDNERDAVYGAIGYLQDSLDSMKSRLDEIEDALATQEEENRG